MITLQVEMHNREGKTLRGIVTLPADNKKLPVVLNLHGFGGTKSGYKGAHTHMARRLCDIGAACVRFDFYGNGESDGEFEEMTFTSLLNDTEDIFNWIKGQPWADSEKIILSGQSLGGFVAASGAPRLKPHALILMCPGMGMWYGCKERADELSAKGIKLADMEGMKFNLEFNYDLAKYNPFEDAKGYNGDTIIIRGTDDALVDDRCCETYLSLYNKNSVYKKIENANHNFASIPARDECESIICAFVQKHI